MAILDRIKFNGMRNGSEWLIYKYPGDSFVTGTQLIVGEGQVAVFVKGGQALDYFTAGTYALSTTNLPLLKSVTKAPFGFKTPYTAEIYFINTTTKLDIAWGTMTPLQLVDPKYNIKLRIRAYGQFGMKVDDYRVLLTELIGTLKTKEIIDYKKIQEYFKGILIMKTKSLIAKAIINKKISALEIGAMIDEISQFCKEELKEEFARFGFKVVNFYIQSINFPDEDFDSINDILRDKATFDIIGDGKYVTKRSFDTMDKAAQNENSSSAAFTGAGIGLGMGAGLGTAVSRLNHLIDPLLVKTTKCPHCNTEQNGENIFCQNCGKKIFTNYVCDNCGKENENYKFCTNCGQEIKKNICPKCKAENNIESKFCKECGTKLEVKR